MTLWRLDAVSRLMVALDGHDRALHQFRIESSQIAFVDVIVDWAET